jgi:hypothetical protein
MKLRNFVTGLLVVLLSFLPNLEPAFAQVRTLKHSKTPSFAAGMYYSKAYDYITSVYAGGSTTSGSFSIQLLHPFIQTADHRSFYPFNTFDPITIGQGSTQETVTPSSVSNCTGPGDNPPGTYCTVTATFSNAHGKGDIIVSGTHGVAEAMSDAQGNGGGLVFFDQDAGNVTLNTGSVTTTLSANYQVPATFYNLGASGYVTTTITTCTGWELGVTGTVAAFTTNNTNLTSTSTAIATQASPAKVGTTNALASVLVTCAGGAAGAGAVHVHVWGVAPVMSNF